MDLRPIAQVVAVEPAGPDGHGVNWLAGMRPKPGDLLYRAADLEKVSAAQRELRSKVTAYEVHCAAVEAEVESLRAGRAVPGWREEVQSLSAMASTAMHQDSRDQRNILEDIADRLCALSAATTPPQAEQAGKVEATHWTEREPVRLAASRVGRVYIAGPMTGIEDFNFPAFNAEASALREQGLSVLNPAEHGIVEGAEWADYLRHDIAGLASCERIHLLRGWSNSKGARLEVTIAQALGMQMTFQDGAEQVPAHPATQPDDALVAHLTADRDDTANELALRTKHNLTLTNERDQLLAKLQATQEPVQAAIDEAISECRSDASTCCAPSRP